MELREIGETDLTRVALYMYWGYKATRQVFSGRLLTVYFNREDVEQAIVKIQDPSTKPFLDYIKLFKSVQAMNSAFRDAVRK